MQVIGYGLFLDSLFDRFAGIFHAFSRLEEHVRMALKERPQRTNEVVYRLFGKKYDSLPSLIQKVLDNREGDLVNRYVTLLSVRQLLKCLRRDFPDFFGDHKEMVRELCYQLEQITALREEFEFETPEVRERFLEWYEQMFSKDMRPA